MNIDPFASLSQGREIKILSPDGTNLLQDYPNTHLLLTNDIELRTENTYGSILGEIEPSNLLNILAGSVKIANMTLPVQNSLQSMAIWQKTEPITMSLEITVPMVNSGKQDVVEPIYKLIGYSLPKKSKEGEGLKGSLIPPGPNLATILDMVGISSKDVAEWTARNTANTLTMIESKGVIKIKVGEYITLPACVITSVVPTFSKELDEDYFPISCTATIEVRTVEVATEDMILQMINALPLVNSQPIKYTHSIQDPLKGYPFTTQQLFDSIN